MEILCPGNAAKAAGRLDKAKRNRNLDMHHGNNLGIIDSKFERAKTALLGLQASAG